jgi:formate-dependent nitrite reductase membrane component NrfD
MPEMTTTRANPLVDPSVHVWHAEVALYLFLGGLVAGIMVLVAARRLVRGDIPTSRELALAPWSVPVLLTLGMIFLWLDLENRWNAFRFYLVFCAATPMSWGAWILLLVYPVSILFAWSETPEELRAGWCARWSRGRAAVRFDGWTLRHARVWAASQLALGVLLGVYTGILLGTFAARPLWNTAALGPLFLTSGLSTGAAFLLLLGLWPREREQLARIDMALIGLEIVVLGLWFAALASGSARSQAAARLFFGGPYTAAFWTLVVALGLVTPLVGEWLERRHAAIPGRATALFILVGGLALRWIVVDAGQSASQLLQLGMR